LARDPAARAEVEAIRGTVALLEKELNAVPCPQMTETQRQEIREGVQPSKEATREYLFGSSRAEVEAYEVRRGRGSQLQILIQCVLGLSLCGAVAVITLQALGTKVTQVFQTINNKLDAAQSQPSGGYAAIKVPQSVLPGAKHTVIRGET